MTGSFYEPLWLSLRLAGISTVILLIICFPLAWWFAKPGHWIKSCVESLVTLPLVLPPTVLGFYLLIVFGVHGVLGRFWQNMTGSTLVFSFSGLVLGSIIFSLPFVVQPLQTAFEQLESWPLELASTLGASSIDRFFSIILPMTKRGFLSAFILGFCHTLGEFGVVLMIGGNIPGKTQVVSIAIFDKVEQLQYDLASRYSLVLLCFSFLILFTLSIVNKYHSQRAL